MKRCPKCQKQFDVTLGFCPHDGTVLESDPTAMVGRVLDGQYEIEAFIAAGGMGAVYRARHILLGDRVAIKILPLGMQQNAEWLRRFQREGQAARRFRHPNAVVVHDLRTSSDGLIYLVMELVEGTTLEQLQHDRGRFSPAESLPIIEAVASVLDAAHAQGVVHRDLKPSNIMVTPDGTVKLLDLGIAKIRDAGPDQTGLTTDGQFLGTPYFMSPEQWGEIPRDGGHEIDGRADVYSLGVVVYQLTAGALPFRGNTAAELRRAHLNEPPPSLSIAGTNAPPEWSAAIMRALSKDRADGPATAGAFARELAGGNAGTTGPANHRATAPTLLNTDTPVAGGARTGAAEGVPISETAGSGTAAAPKRSWTVSLLHNRGCQVTFTVAAMLVIGVAVGIPLLLNYNKSDSYRNAPTANKNTTGSTGNPSPQPTTGSPGKFVKFHLLVSNGPFETAESRAPGKPVGTNQIVQFALTPSTSGYLYLFSRGENGDPVSVPLDPIGGHSYLVVTADAEVSAPNVPILKVRNAPGDENFTFVIAKEELEFADGLGADGSLRPLSAAETTLLETLKQNSAKATLFAEDDYGIVSLQSAAGDRPVVFYFLLVVNAR